MLGWLYPADFDFDFVGFRSKFGFKFVFGPGRGQAEPFVRSDFKCFSDFLQGGEFYRVATLDPPESFARAFRSHNDFPSGAPAF